MFSSDQSRRLLLRRGMIAVTSAGDLARRYNRRLEAALRDGTVGWIVILIALCLAGLAVISFGIGSMKQLATDGVRERIELGRLIGAGLGDAARERFELEERVQVLERELEDSTDRLNHLNGVLQALADSQLTLSETTLSTLDRVRTTPAELLGLGGPE